VAPLLRNGKVVVAKRNEKLGASTMAEKSVNVITRQEAAHLRN